MKLTREKLILLSSVLQHAERIFKSPNGKFYYAFRRNRDIANEEYKLSFEAYPVDPKYQEYQIKRREIFNENGVFNDFALQKLAVNDIEKFNAMQERQRKLAEEYKEAIETENKVGAERNEFFKEELDNVPLRRVSVSDVPEIDEEFVAQIGFTVCQVFDAIEPMVEYNDAEKAEEKTETKDK